MIDLKLDPANWDLICLPDDLLLVEDGDQVIQHIKQRLLHFLGEWFLDLGAGVPWFQEILGKPQRLDIVESIIKATIRSTPGVLALVSFSLDADPNRERTMLVNFTVRIGDEETSQQIEVTI
jgi:hypothetical protein